MKKTELMNWIDGQLRADVGFARDVEVLVNEMKIEQALVALREKGGLSQRAFAKILGTSQPYVAKLESGRINHLGVKTLVKAATALGATVTVKIESKRRVALAPRPRAAASVRAKAARRAK